MFSLFRNTAKKEIYDSGKDLARWNHHRENKSEEFRNVTNAGSHPDKSHTPAVQSDPSSETDATPPSRVEDPPERKVCQDKVYQNTVKSGGWAGPGYRKQRLPNYIVKG